MKRTTIMLPERLKARVEHRARSEGLSVGEFVRRALVEALAAGEGAGQPDPLLMEPEVFRGEIPEDTSVRHDSYLYDG